MVVEGNAVPSQVAQATTLLTCILGVSVRISAGTPTTLTYFLVILNPSSQITRQYFNLDHDRFRPDPFNYYPPIFRRYICGAADSVTTLKMYKLIG
jgi:hypothetical protein